MKSLLVGLAIMFCLLMSNIAIAQCGWVLWSFHYLADERTCACTIDSAFPNYELCMKQLNRNLEGMKKGFEATPGGKINSFDYGFSVDIKDESGKEKHFKFLFKCLPDTVDPRK